jgi:hypothetical protein
MRNFRKTRKSGGADVVFVCLTGRTADKLCIKDFSDNANLQFEDVPPDGNCFFHTLEKYYRKKGNRGADKDHKELRARVVNYILTNWDNYAMFGIDQEDILELTEDGAWNNDAGDLVVPAASRALNIQIKLYDIKPGQRSPPIKKRIIRHIYPDTPPIPAEIVNILRINQGHFGLLVDAPVAPAVNAVENIAKKVKTMSISNKGTPTAPTTGRVTRSRAKSPVNKKPVTVVEAKKKSRKRTNSNKEAENLQKALIASLAESKKSGKKNKQLSENFLNRLVLNNSFTNV